MSIKLEKYENGIMIDLSEIFKDFLFINYENIINICKQNNIEIKDIIWIIISNTKIEKIDTLLSFYNLRYLDCSNNKLHNLPALPLSIIEIDCSNNYINDISQISSLSLKRLNCINNNIKEIISDTINILYCSQNSIININCPSVEQLICNENNLQEINLNKNIRIADCSHNKLLNIDLTQCNKIEELYIDNNLITIIPYSCLKILHCDDNNDIKLASKYKIKEMNKENDYIIFEFCV